MLVYLFQWIARKLQVKTNIQLHQTANKDGGFVFILAEKSSHVLCFNTSYHTIQMLSAEYFSNQLQKQKILVSKIQPRNQSGRKKMYLKTNGFMQETVNWCKLRLHAKPPWWFILDFSSAFSRDSDRWSLLHVVMLTWSLSPWNNPSGNMRLKALEKFTVIWSKCCSSGGEERFLQRSPSEERELT